jgi:NitT/TauT family transport system substrate-binding protein
LKENINSRREMGKHMKKLKQLPGIILFALFAIHFVEFQSYAASAKKINMAYSTLGSLQTGVWIAEELGFFQKYGLDADLVYISSGPLVIQALIGGDLQVGMAGANALIAAALGGAPITALLVTSNTPYHRIFVQPDIKTIGDLRGKTLGVTRFGSLTDGLTRVFLKKADLEGAVTIRQMGGIREVNAAFEQRVIDGLVQGDLRVPGHIPFKVLTKLEDMGIKHAMDVLVVTRAFLERNPKDVEAIVRAYVEGVAALHTQKDAARRIIAKYTRLSDPVKVDEIYGNAVSYTAKNPRVEREAIQSHLQLIGKKDVNIEEIADNSIINRLIQEGFIDRLYQRR